MGDVKRTLPVIVFQIPAVLFVPLCVLYFELLFSLFLDYRITMYTVGFSLAAAALLTAVSFVTKNSRVHFVLQGIEVCVVSILFLSQFLYYQIFQTLYIVQSLGGAGKAASFLNVVFDKIKENPAAVLLFLLPIVLFFFLQRILIKKLAYSIRLPLIALASFLVLTAGTSAAALYDNNGALSPRYLCMNSFVQDKSLSSFGLLTTMTLDVKYNVLNLHTDEDENVDIGGIKIVEPVSAAAGSETTPIILETSAAVTESSSTGTSVAAPSPTTAQRPSLDWGSPCAGGNRPDR